LAGSNQCGAEKSRRNVTNLAQAESKLADQANKNQSQMQKAAQRAQDGKSAMADYEAEAQALRAKTERLKALRLAREAVEPAPAAKQAVTKKAKAGKKTKGTSATLSAWLRDQKNGGRST
jgi:hypothetical protein